MSRKRRYQPRQQPQPQATAKVSVLDSMRAMLMPVLSQSAASQTVDIRERYRPPVTLGCSEQYRIAMDEALDAAGVYTILEHTNGDYKTFPQFLGYGALQNISQNGLIRACVSTVADDMTREWIELTRQGEQEGGDDKLVEELTTTMEAKQLQRVFHDALELVGYEGGAFIYIDTGARDSQLALPLEISPQSAELVEGGHLRFVPVDPVNCAPGSYNATDPLQPDYYKPKYWLVLGRPVHSSRLIRLVANEVPILLKPAYNFFGIPQAQILWDYVQHFQENRTAVDRLLTKFSMTVFKTKMFDGLVGFGQEQATGLDTRIKFMVQNMSNDGVLAVDKENEDVVKLETPLSGLTDITRQSLELLAAINRTPAVKLLGISPSGFNATGESDIRNYYDHIASMQTKQMANGIKTALDCLQLHLHGTVDPSISFRFKPLGDEDKSLQATTRKTMLEGICLLLDRDVVSVEEARKVLAQDPDSGFDDIDPEDVPEPSNMPDAEEQAAVGSIMEQPDADVDATVGSAGDAEDEEVWRTAKNGKKYQVETETGEITKGNVGQKLPETQELKESYKQLLSENGGDHFEAARQLYRGQLQGKNLHVKTNEGGEMEVAFTGTGWRELKRDMKKDPLKAELVAQIPDILSSGSYQKNSLYKERADGAVAFHSFSKRVTTSQDEVNAIVDVRENRNRTKKNEVYSMVHQNMERYRKRTQPQGADNKESAVLPSQVKARRGSNDAFNQNLEPVCEFVNIRYEKI